MNRTLKEAALTWFAAATAVVMIFAGLAAFADEPDYGDRNRAIDRQNSLFRGRDVDVRVTYVQKRQVLVAMPRDDAYELASCAEVRRLFHPNEVAALREAGFGSFVVGSGVTRKPYTAWSGEDCMVERVHRDETVAELTARQNYWCGDSPTVCNLSD